MNAPIDTTTLYSFILQGKAVIVVSDLDGTFLDHHTYDFSESKAAAEDLLAQGIPTIFNTSKTFAEVSVLLDEMEVDLPFVVENGSAIYFPKSYFPAAVCERYIDSHPQYSLSDAGKNYELKLGIDADSILTALRTFEDVFRVDLPGYRKWSIEDVMAATGLSQDEAERSKTRQYSEVLSFDFDLKQSMMSREQVLGELRQYTSQLNFGLLEGGRFYHVLGKTDKGKAVQVLRELYAEHLQKEIVVVALGDSPNDTAMLQVADIAAAVKKPDGTHLSIDSENSEFIQRIIKSNATAPKGWAEVFHRLGVTSSA